MKFTKEEIENEIWKPYPEFPDHYEVSTLERVRSFDRIQKIKSRWGQLINRPKKGRILAQPIATNNSGYQNYKFSINGKIHTKMVHRLVCETFNKKTKRFKSC